MEELACGGACEGQCDDALGLFEGMKQVNETVGQGIGFT